MGLSTTFVSGPRRCGKSALIRLMVDQFGKRQPHYLRLVQRGSDKVPPKPVGPPPTNCGVASARWLEYCPERVFELIQDALSGIHKADRFGAVLIEADADPVLRHAYPYDHRIFVMPTPPQLGEVFRHPADAATELRRALDDTTAFAEEVFGLFDRGVDRCDPSEDRADFSPAQMFGFLHSPLGEELATRIQLQPAYHGLVESDVIVVNTSVGERSPETHQCLHRIEKLLDRMRRAAAPRAELTHCDPRDAASTACRNLLKLIKPFCVCGK